MPGTGATPVSIKAIPTPWPVSVAAVPDAAFMIVRTSFSVVPVALVAMPELIQSPDAQPPAGARCPSPVALSTAGCEATSTTGSAATTAPVPIHRASRFGLVLCAFTASPSVENRPRVRAGDNHDEGPVTDSH
jgi:hypothetical protein